MYSKEERRLALEVERTREAAIETGYYCFCTEGNELDGNLKVFFDKNKDVPSYPAVDLGSDLGVLTAALALRHRKPSFPASLEWYPTDKNPERTSRGLAFLAKDLVSPEILFHDRQGMPVHMNECITLQGLSSAKFNDREGKVFSADPDNEGRYGVRVYNEKKRLEPKTISVKQENIYSYPSLLFETRMLQHMKSTGTDNPSDLFQGLAERVRRVEVTPEGVNTWGNIRDLFGKCALVTHLSPAIAENDYERPPGSDWWQGCLLLADLLLTEGGFLVLFGRFDDYGFGNIALMEKYTIGRVERGTMHLVLDEIMDQRYVPDLGFELVMALWRKVSPAYEGKVAEFRNRPREETNTILYWHPEVPGNEDEKLPEANDKSESIL